MNVISLSYLSVNHVLICMNCYKCMAYSTIDLVGLVMGFVSVVLAFISIRMTCKVHREVVSQAFKTKQSECMANLVRDLNEFEFQIEYNKRGKNPVYKNVNLVGIIEIDSRDDGFRYNFESYNKLPITYANNFSFAFMEKYISNAYIPQNVSRQLYQFLNRPSKEHTSDSISDFVQLYFCGERNSHIKVFQLDSIYTDLETFMHNIEMLINCINKWYDKQLHSKPNFISVNQLYMQSKEEDIKKV